MRLSPRDLVVTCFSGVFCELGLHPKQVDVRELWLSDVYFASGLVRPRGHSVARASAEVAVKSDRA